MAAQLQRVIGNRAIGATLKPGEPKLELVNGEAPAEQQARRAAEKKPKAALEKKAVPKPAPLITSVGATTRLSPAVAARVHAARTGGTTLPRRVRQRMEEDLGHGFGEVRVHADESAARAARVLGARAFTVGRDIFFASGEWQPETASGHGLLVHELTHVVQSSSLGGGAELVFLAPDTKRLQQELLESRAEYAAAVSVTVPGFTSDPDGTLATGENITQALQASLAKLKPIVKQAMKGKFAKVTFAASDTLDAEAKKWLQATATTELWSIDVLLPGFAEMTGSVARAAAIGRGRLSEVKLEHAATFDPLTEKAKAQAPAPEPKPDPVDSSEPVYPNEQPEVDVLRGVDVASVMKAEVPLLTIDPERLRRHAELSEKSKRYGQPGSPFPDQAELDKLRWDSSNGIFTIGEAYAKAFEKATQQIGYNILDNYKIKLQKTQKTIDWTARELDRHQSLYMARRTGEEWVKIYKEERELTRKSSPLPGVIAGQKRPPMRVKELKELEEVAEGNIRSLTDYYPFVSVEYEDFLDFDWKALAATRNAEEVEALLRKDLKLRFDAVEDAYGALADPTDVHDLDVLVEKAKLVFGVEPHGRADQMLAFRAKQRGIGKMVLGMMTAAIAMIPGPGWATAIALAASAGMAYASFKEYKDQKAAQDAGLMTDEPSALFLLLSVVEVGVTASAFVKLAGPLWGRTVKALRGTEIADVEAVRQAYRELKGLDKSAAAALDNALDADIAFKKAVAEFHGSAGQLQVAGVGGKAAGVPKHGGNLAVLCYRAVKRGNLRYQDLVRDFKRAKIFEKLSEAEAKGLEALYDAQRTKALSEPKVKLGGAPSASTATAASPQLVGKYGPATEARLKSLVQRGDDLEAFASRRSKEIFEGTDNAKKGAFIQALGEKSESIGDEVIDALNKARGKDKIVSKPGPKLSDAKIDRTLKSGGRELQLEMKYKFADKAGEPLDRLAKQCRAMTREGEGQAVVWSLRQPSPKDLEKLREMVGDKVFKQIKIVNGPEELYAYLDTFFR
jgi:hypothetical protein